MSEEERPPQRETTQENFSVSRKRRVLIERIRHIPRLGEFGRNATLLASSTAAGQLLSVLAAPLLTRLYTPSDFGVVAVFGSVVALLLVCSSLRLEWAIPLPEDKEIASHIMITSFLVLVMFSLALSALLILHGRPLGEWKYLSAIRPYLWIVPITVFGAGAYQVFAVWAIRTKDFRSLAKTRIRQSIGSTSIQLGLGFFHAGPLGLIFGNLAGWIVGVDTLTRMAWQSEKNLIRTFRMSYIKDVYDRYGKISLFSTGSSLINTAGIHIVPFLLAAFYGPAVAGWFALSQRVIGIPSALVGNAIAQTFWGEAARLIHHNPDELRNLFFRLSKKLLVVSSLIGFIGIISPWVFGFVFGRENWQMAGMYALCLTPMVIVQFIVSPISHLGVHELQRWQFYWDFTRMILSFGCLLIGYSQGFSPQTTIFIFSLVMSLMYIILYGLNINALRARIRVGEQ